MERKKIKIEKIEISKLKELKDERQKGYIVENIKPLNVYSDKLQMCIEQEMIGKKTNEITAISEVIKRLDLTNVIYTWDALNTKKDNVKAVMSNGTKSEEKRYYISSLLLDISVFSNAIKKHCLIYKL